MSIQVVGAGLGRTGTLSLKAALEELGIGRCYHPLVVFASLDQARTWDAAARGEPVDWDRLFAGYRATVDLPGCLFYRELLEKYPEAKVILTVRDPERWYDSVRQTIHFASNTFPKWAVMLSPRMLVFQRMLDRLWDRLFRGRFEDRAFAIEVFNRHNEQVRRDVPADRLLVYEVGQGWGPLCVFLGVPVPEGKPFPHLNDAVEFRARLERDALIVRTVGYAALGVAAGAHPHRGGGDPALVLSPGNPFERSDGVAWASPGGGDLASVGDAHPTGSTSRTTSGCISRLRTSGTSVGCRREPIEVAGEVVLAPEAGQGRGPRCERGPQGSSGSLKSNPSVTATRCR